MKRRTAILILIIALQACAQEPANSDMKNPVELGQISWQREISAAGKSKRPVLLLFQEVPG